MVHNLDMAVGKFTIMVHNLTTMVVADLVLMVDNLNTVIGKFIFSVFRG
jgi:hypothetical protein